jgi:hypothetical protein
LFFNSKEKIYYGKGRKGNGMKGKDLRRKHAKGFFPPLGRLLRGRNCGDIGGRHDELVTNVQCGGFLKHLTKE